MKSITFIVEDDVYQKLFKIAEVKQSMVVDEISKALATYIVHEHEKFWGSSDEANNDINRRGQSGT